MTVDLMNHILFDKQYMIIKDLLITDQETVSFFRDLKEPSEITKEFEKILKLGTIITKTVNITEKIDYVQKELNRMGSKFKGSIDSFTRDLNANCEAVFGYGGTFSNILKEHFGENGTIVRDYLDPHKEGTPLYKMLKEIVAAIIESRQQNVTNKELEKARANTT